MQFREDYEVDHAASAGDRERVLRPGRQRARAHRHRVRARRRQRDPRSVLMPTSRPRRGRAQADRASGVRIPIYLIVGDDDAEMSRLAADIAALVEEELRAFNVERVYAADEGRHAGGDRRSGAAAADDGRPRVVVVLRGREDAQAEAARQGRRGQAGEDDEDGSRQTSRCARGLRPSAGADRPCSSLVAPDVDRTRRLYKQLHKTATIVECWGLKRTRTRALDPRQIARQAEQLVRQAATEAGQQIEPAAARLVAERAGTDIARLRGDVERLLLYAAGRPEDHASPTRRRVVSAETAQDDWAVTNAIQRGNTARGAAPAGAVARVGARALS